MGALADRLGGKNPGELIRAQDWNDLIGAIETLEASLTANLEAVSARVETGLAEAAQRAAALEARVAAVEALAEPLQQFRRVSLRTGQELYALGQSAQLVATVTDFRGSALDLADPAARPWVEFVATGGQLRPDPAFNSVGSEGDRAISVQVDARGEARVFLVAEAGAAESTGPGRTSVAELLETRLTATNQTLVQSLLEANTPLEAKLSGALRAVSIAYDQPAAVETRRYLDTSFHAAATQSLLPVEGEPDIRVVRWQHYRYTVLAFVKNDNQPGTAEPSQGASSIQVRFRDWIRPWARFEYLEEYTPVKESIKDRVRAKIDADPLETSKRLRAEILESVRDKGHLGRQREYLAIAEGLDEVTVTNPPAFLPDLTRTLIDAVSVQQALERGAAPTGERETTFQVMAEAGSRSQINRSELRLELGAELRQEITRATREVQETVSRNLLADDSPLLREDSPLLREDSPVRKFVSQQLSPLRQQVTAIQQVADPNVVARKGEVGVLDTRLKNIEAILQRPDR